jgi:hypothetical protein
MLHRIVLVITLLLLNTGGATSVRGQQAGAPSRYQYALITNLTFDINSFQVRLVDTSGVVVHTYALPLPQATIDHGRFPSLHTLFLSTRCGFLPLALCLWA